VGCRIKCSGEEPYKELVQVMHIIADATSALDFNDCLTSSAIDNSFAQSASNVPQNMVEYSLLAQISHRPPSLYYRSYDQVAYMQKSTNGKVNNRSCFETKLNALKTLVENGFKLVNVRNGTLLVASLIGIWKMF
jgi:hypothetical protein